ncbi:MAG: hypothetical protein ACYTG6_14435 [Planctomycetota bacterium]
MIGDPRTRLEYLVGIIDEMEAALRKIKAKCVQYANAPRLCEAEQRAVHEWIEREARKALGEEEG